MPAALLEYLAAMRMGGEAAFEIEFGEGREEIWLKDGEAEGRE